jgi:hypothetical protein
VSESDKTSVIERVRKILAKTEQAGCTAQESESAFQLASRIMAEHNLDMAEIEAKEGGEQSWLEDEIQETGRWTLEQNLAYGIAREFFFVEGFFNWRWANGSRRKVLQFFGRPENVATARWAFNSLLDAFDRLFAEYRRRSGCPASDRRLFISGVADGFRSKMKDERRAVEIERDLVQGKTSGNTAIVLRSLMEQTAEAFRQAHAAPKKKPRGIRFTQVTGSQSALEAGYDAGRSLQLNRSIGDSTGGSQHKGLPSQ